MPTPPQKVSKAESSVDDLARKNVQTIANMENVYQLQRTLGDKVADRFASIIGSWKFIIIQSCILAIWVILNIVAVVQHWDPYPFILLNLALSFQAAYASPIIMMSQNRQARLSERRNQLDLQVNLLSEQEATETLRLLRAISEKLDIKITDTANVHALSQQIKPDTIVKDIQEAIEDKQDGKPDEKHLGLEKLDDSATT